MWRNAGLFEAYQPEALSTIQRRARTWFDQTNDAVCQLPLICESAVFATP
jgi:hypothetical protein